MQNYKLFCANKKINHFNVYSENMNAVNHISISFVDNNEHLHLYAVGDCCSSSWFHFVEIDNDQLDFKEDQKEFDYLTQKLNKFMVGKIIESIDIMNDIELPSSGVQEVDINHLVRMKFTDGSNYDFVLRNSSNGYYDGWIEINIVNSIYPPNIQEHNTP
ncbi:hypothetical protein QJ856_gp0016 [Tupanvirus deep ocean]|uniref:Uncharacterized protein n=2 Tax=Tupanvirus TaxID=2094720 RepID=A0AC62A6P1_9VIRU|nr:hypothetical protein QJ856_gp0016 [Tupanvirus deep ocean]QKU33434.1 hypothetical protein [Tupanvirus deep ocean]